MPAVTSPYPRPSPVKISLTKTLAAIQEARKATTENRQIEEWLKPYRETFKRERQLALRLQEPPSSDSEDETDQPRSSQYLKGTGMVLKLSPEVFYEVSKLFTRDQCEPMRTFIDLLVDLLVPWVAGPSVAFENLQAFSGVSSLHIHKKAMAKSNTSGQRTSSLSEGPFRAPGCGMVVFDAMDTKLHVKLCPQCQTELLEAYPANEHVQYFVPATESFRVSPQGSVVLVLKRDIDQLIREAAAFQAGNPDASLDKWGSARTKAIRKRNENESKLGDFLGSTLRARAEKVEKARHERRRQIGQRLVQGVWSLRDMRFSDELLESWERLVKGMKPIDDREWNKLQPKLEALLITNRERKEERARDGRRRERHGYLITHLSGLKYSSPLLAEATIEGFGREYAETVYRCHDRDGEEISKVKAPFPTPASAMNIPIVRNLVEKDISGSEMGQDFDLLRDLITQYIAAWRTQVERDLVNIWGGATEPPLALDHEVPAAVNQASQHPNDGSASTETRDTTKPAKSAPLPKVQLKFTKADGKTTQNIQELPEDLRLLLRADVVFRTQGSNLPIKHCSYPEIASGPKPDHHSHSSRTRSALGDPWDPTAISRDEDGTRVARLFLGALQLPNATVAEMKAYGAIFKCCRCQHLTPSTWQSLVSHYATEMSRFKEAQERIRELGPTVVYNDTHNLDAKGLRFKIIPPKSGEYPSSTRTYGKDVACKVCGSLGIMASYRHEYASTKTEMCPILEHLADAHGITNPIINEHFEDPYQDESEDVSSEEDDDDDCDTDYSYHGAPPTSDELADIAEEAGLYIDSDGDYDRDEAMAYFRRRMKYGSY